MSLKIPDENAVSPAAARIKEVMLPTDYPTEKLLGWEFAAFTERQCVERILKELRAGRGGWLITVNLDHLRRLALDEAYATLCRQADILVADGMPLIWASRIQRTPLPERVAGSSLVSTLSAGAAAEDRSVFLLGGESGTAQEAAAVLTARHPEIKIAGTCCPTIDSRVSPDDPGLEATLEALSAANPDIVYVGLGSPKQELLIDQFRTIFPGTWWIGVGISFSYLCDRIRRPPVWAREAGMEWFFRLLQEPRRLSGRYLRDDLPFFFVLLARASARRLRKSFARRLL